MPNWCYNRISIYADSDQVSQLKEINDIFENHKDPFNQIFPIPDFKNIPNDKGELPKLEQMKNPDGSVLWETYNFPDGKNDDRWYHWCIDNWGTKWDVSDLSIDYEDDEQLELTFNTAWSPPEGIVDKLKKKYPDLTFTCFYDEPGMEVAGYYQMYHLDQTKNLVQTIIKVIKQNPMNTLKVTDEQLEYLRDLVLEAYSNDVAEQKEWNEDSFEGLVDAICNAQEVK